LPLRDIAVGPFRPAVLPAAPAKASFDYVESNEVFNVMKIDRSHATSCFNEVAV